MNTKKFRTRTEIVDRNNGRVSGKWLIACDNGYSGTKIFSPSTYATFPTYARRVDSSFQFVGKAPASAILYKDSKGQMWVVGETAQNTMTSGDTLASESVLCGRERYYDPMFLVTLEVGLGLGMLGNEFGAPGSNEIYVQTGLPERYMDDEPLLKEVFAGTHEFELKIGGGSWMKFSFHIKEENVFVMSQPKGTLFSTIINSNGTFRPDAEQYLSSSVIVFDPGFGTLDLFPILCGSVEIGETYTDLGMHRVLSETCKKIKETHGVSISVPSMQKNLETGTVIFSDRKTLTSKEIPFVSLLAEACNEVLEEAIERLNNLFNLTDYKYLIVTGGTGEAWMHAIEEKFKDFKTLTIIKGNQNDELPLIYSNVRGYFYYRLAKMKNSVAGR